MHLLRNLRPLMHQASVVKLTLSMQAGHMVALIEPSMIGLDPDTTDPELAALQKALARPLRLTFDPDGDPDLELAQALTVMNKARAPNLLALDNFRDAQAEANTTATVARASKPPKATTTTPAAPARSARSSSPTPGSEPAPTSSTGAEGADADDGADHDTDTEASSSESGNSSSDGDLSPGEESQEPAASTTNSTFE